MSIKNKSYIKIYCILASIFLYVLPIYRQTPSGVIIRPSFPHNYCLLHNIIKTYVNMIQIDWVLLLVELLLSAFILCFIYLEED